MKYVCLKILMLCALADLAYATSGITYHGRLIKPDGTTPVSSSTTQFRIQIRTPGSENCLLWEEQQTKDLSATNGIFAITINDTSEPTLIPNTLPFGLDRVFSNRTNFSSLTSCSVGNSYNPSATDGRTIQVQFRETVSDPWEQMPLTKINFVPLALNTVQLEGYRATEFLKIDSASSYTPLTATQVNTLMDIIAGTNTQYLRPSSAFSGDVSGTYSATSVDKIKGVSVSTTAPTNGQVLKYNGTAWAPAADDTGNPGDASYAAKGIVQINTDQATSGLYINAGVLALPNVITAGGPTGGASTIPVITYDQKGRLTAVTTATVNDTTKLPLAGGTMTGNINMGGNNLTNATSVTATNVGTRNLVLSDNDTNTLTLKTPADISANFTFTLPGDGGAAGKVLATDGSGTLSWVSPNSGLTLTANKAVIANGTGTALTAFSCSINQVFSFDASGNPACANVTASGGFLNGGNSFGADANLGLNDNFDLNIKTNNTTQLTVTKTGNVGLGTTNPTEKLYVVGNIAIDGGNVNKAGSISVNQAQSKLRVRSYDNGNTTDLDLFANSAAVLSFNGTEKMRLTANGYLGIDTASPNTALDINGALSQKAMVAPAVSPAGEGRIYFDSTANKFKVSQNGGGYVDLVNSSSATASGTSGRIAKFTAASALGDSLLYDNGTTVSIGGSASTGFPFEVQANVDGPVMGTFNTSASANASSGISFYTNFGRVGSIRGMSTGNTYGGSSYQSKVLLESENPAGLALLASDAAGSITFSTGGSAAANKRMVISSSGNVGIGAANPGYSFELDGGTFYMHSGSTPYLYGTQGNVGIGTSLTPIAGLDLRTPEGAAGGVAYGAYMSQNLQASANNDVLNALYVAPTFTDNSKTGVAHNGLIVTSGNSGFNTTDPTFGINLNSNYRSVGIAGAGTDSQFNMGNINLANNRATVSTGDFLGNINFVSKNNAGYAVGASIMGSLEGTGGASGFGGNIRFSTKNDNQASVVERMRIDSSGNVGIGITNPTSAFDVSGAFTQRGMAAPSLSSAGQGRIYFDSTANKFKVSENGGAYVDLGSGGGSGISGLTTGYIPKAASATTIGNSNLQATTEGLKIITTNSGVSALEIGADSGGKSSYLTFSNSGVAQGQIGGYDGELQIDTVVNGPLVFKTNSTERMRILGTGNIGVGVVSPTTALDLDGAFNIRGMAAPAVSAAGQGRIYYDSTSNTVKLSQNGGAYADITTNASSNFVTSAAYSTDVTPAASCTTSQTPYWNTISDTWACQNINVTTAGGFFKDGGNSLGAAASLGTNDNFALNFRTNNSVQATLTTSGDFSLPNGGFESTGSTTSRALISNGDATAVDFLSGNYPNSNSGVMGYTDTSHFVVGHYNSGSSGFSGYHNLSSYGSFFGFSYDASDPMNRANAPAGLYIYDYYTKMYASGYPSAKFDVGTISTYNYSAVAADGSKISMTRYRGVPETPANVQNGDEIGQVNFAGNYNLNEVAGARISATVTSATMSTSSLPSKLSFFTTDASASLTEKVTILGNGNTGIGVTSPSEKLEVNGNVKATSFISTSDIRLKTNIKPVVGLDAILKLNGVRWDWKNGSGPDAGVIAQDLEKVFPEAVRTDTETGFKGVKYQYLFAPLIESTKELYGMCKQNDSRIQNVQRGLASVETKLDSQSLEIQKLKDDNQKLKKENEDLKKRLDKIERILGAH